jgi:hypothetical protein
MAVLIISAQHTVVEAVLLRAAAAAAAAACVSPCMCSCLQCLSFPSFRQQGCIKQGLSIIFNVTFYSTVQQQQQHIIHQAYPTPATV